MTSSDTTADAEVLSARVPGGATIAIRWTPGPAGAPVVVIVPALGVVARAYRRFADELRQRGLGVAVIDLRGTGASTPRVDRKAAHGFHTTASVDLPAALDAVRAASPSSAVVLLGHSLGGQLAPLFLAHSRPAVAGLALVAAGTPHFRAYPAARGLVPLLSTNIIAGVSKVRGYWPGDRLRFAGRQSRVLVGDWARLCRGGRYELTDADVDYEALLADLRLPVLAVDVAGDRLAPPSAVDGLLAHFPQSRVTRRRCEPVLGHIGWTAKPAAVAEVVAPWVHEVTAAHAVAAVERGGDGALPRG